MATFYGPWVATDDFRAILEATVSNTSATQCTVKLVVKIQSNYAHASSSGRASVTCNGTTRSASVAYSAGKTTTLMTESFTVARGSSSKQISVSGKVWQLNASSAYSKGSTASGKVNIPAIDYDAPNAPSSCAASRVSDTSAKVTWTNGGTTTLKPRSSVKVERQTDGGSWSQIASVGASTANYTDNSISANHRYAYRVRSYGAGGYSGYSTSGYIYTTPAAPSSVSITKTSGTQVSISVGTSSSPYATAWEVQESLNGGEWTAVGSFTTFPQTVDVGGGTAKLRVRAVRGSLASAWVESNQVTTIVAPNAPTITNKPASVVPVGDMLVVQWRPNHPDGTEQTEAQVGWTFGDSPEEVVDIYGDGTTSTYLSTEPCSVKVRVRTKGLAEGWGAWSSYYSFTVAVPPEAHFTAPGVDGVKIGDLPLTVAWEVVDDTGVAAQTLQLTDDAGRVLHTASPSTGAREYELGASTYQLANAMAYRLVLTVRGGSSLTVTTTRDFSTSFAEPSRPSADVELDESAMSQAVTVHAGPSTSDTGEVIEVSATPGTLVPGLTVYGATRQNLWVNPVTSGPYQGMTVTEDENGAITVSGTATADTYIVKGGIYSLKPSTKYTVSVDKKFSSWGFYIECAAKSGNTSFYFGGTWNYTEITRTFTTPADMTHAAFAVAVESGATVSGTYRVMLNEGDTAKPWCPPGINGVEPSAIVTAGKNLWKNPSGTGGGITVTPQDDGSITVSGTVTGYCDVYVADPVFKPNTKYTISVDKRLAGAESAGGVGFYVYNGTTTWYAQSRSEQSLAFTTTDDVSSMRVGFYINNNISAVAGATISGTYKVMLNVGESAEPWEPPATITPTPIDMQGHALYEIGDARDVLHVDGTGAASVERYIGDISSYGGENIGDTWLASELDADGNPATGAHVIYLLDEPQTVELDSTVVMPEFPADPTTMWAVSDIPGEVAVAYPDTDSLSVTRILADGSRWLVADGLEDGEQAIDPLPPLNVPYSYEVAASTAAGATSEVRVTETLRALVGAFNFGQAAGLCELARLDPDWKHDVARSGTLYHFADGGEGGGLPVAYGGQDVDATRSMGFTLLDLDQLRRMQDLAREYFTCWYRDPYGGRALCSVSWSFSSGIPYGKLDVSASMTETVFEEAW